MKKRSNSMLPRASGSTMIVVMGLMIVVSMVSAAMLSYTGAEFGRSRRVVRAIKARDCALSGIQWGRWFIGQRQTSDWNTILSGAPGTLANFNNPAFVNLDFTGAPPTGVNTSAMGRIDGHAVTGGFPADFIVTVRDNPDEWPPKPKKDNDLVVILRSECVRPGAQLPGTQNLPTPQVTNDPDHGNIRLDGLDQRRNVVVEAYMASIDWAGYHNRGTDSKI